MVLLSLLGIVLLPLLLSAARPLFIRIMSDDIAGPGGWYFDTERNSGILDIRVMRR